MPERGHREEKKQLVVEVNWIRPNKICAIFDLILAILCYIIALANGSWVIEKYEYEDDSKKIDINYNKYWVGLWQQCYRVSRAKELLDFACVGLPEKGDNLLKNTARGDSTNLNELSCGEDHMRLTKIINTDPTAEECIGLGDSLPWAHGLTFAQLHFNITRIMLVLCLVVAVACLIVALFIYCRREKKNNLSHFYKIIGIVLFVVFIINLALVVYFGIAFSKNAPYSSEDWFFWTGYGFCFAASILVLIAAVLFYFGADWKKTGYSARRTVNF